MKIRPVILVGGSGTRLWPVSRKSHPKQFLDFGTEKSLFQECVYRVATQQNQNFINPIVVTNIDHCFAVQNQLNEFELNASAILVEPEGKNTAAAVLAACFFESQNDPDATLLVLPSDQLIKNDRIFHEAVSNGLSRLDGGNIVTFGVVPTRPEVGYGYLKIEGGDIQKAANVEQFIEKPNLPLAKRMFRSGNFLWNSGIFLFSAREMLLAFEQHSPDLIEPVKEAVESRKSNNGFHYLDAKSWSDCNSISLDYAVMERVDNLFVVPFFGGWNDMGGWDAVWEENSENEDDVVTLGNSSAIDCSNSLLFSNDKEQHLVGLGLDNIVAVSTSDAVLVASKDRTNDVSLAVSTLTNQGVYQSERSKREYRPWGWFDILVKADYHQVKRICVLSGGLLSLQSHKYRSEHWVVVEGKAKVTLNDEVKSLAKGEATFIPPGAIHRLENETETPLIIIEVQIGNYLGEDDITRYEDIYSRV